MTPWNDTLIACALHWFEPLLLRLQMGRYDNTRDGVTIHFDRGQPSVHAKRLIGADGYFSRICKQCLNDGPPMFSVRPLLTYIAVHSSCGHAWLTAFFTYHSSDVVISVPASLPLLSRPLVMLYYVAAQVLPVWAAGDCILCVRTAGHVMQHRHCICYVTLQSSVLLQL